MNEQEIKQKLNNTVGKSFIYDKKKIFINKIESSDLYYKIHIDGDLLIFKKENIETEFLDLIQTKIKFETIVPVKPIPSVFKNQTIETNTPATTIEFNTPATTMESNTPATTIETNTPATTMESNTPATTIETNTLTTQNNLPSTESQIVEFSFKSQADLYNSALDGSNELKDALKDTLTRLKAATTTEQLEMEMTRSKGVAMISKEMNSLMNSKIKAIQVISNS